MDRSRAIYYERWTEAEQYIMKDPELAYFYAKNIIKGRWPEAEPYIMQTYSKWWNDYKECFNIKPPFPS